MNNHYYTAQPESKHERVKWSFPLLGSNFAFITDNGVFSKKTVDFGSQVLLNTLSKQEPIAGSILDVGCGYGVLGLALARLTKQKVEMIDINERAVQLARENAALNQIENVTIYTSNVYEKVERNDYAMIVSNPPIRAGKEVVFTILEEAKKYLKIGGKLVIVIQKKQGAPSAERKMQETFGNVEILAKKKGYYILQSYKKTENLA